MFERIKELLVGKPRDIEDPELFHKISLIAFLAWVGLGADGLSSSAYGPDEAFRALSDPRYGDHTYLAIFLALATGLTVFIISFAYSGIIEHFPSGGGGYLVSTKLLGERFGLVSGSALLIDYVLTITTSIASAANALFDIEYFQRKFEFNGVEHSTMELKLPFEAFAIIVLIILNLRGVKESIKVLVPIFLFFLLTHIILLGGIFFMHGGRLPAVFSDVSSGVRSGLSNPAIGLVGLLLLFARAYSMGAGTFTGIEAVSNGLQIMREPRVKTGKRTMVYMALSLALMAGGILLGYKILGVTPVEGKPLNASLAESLGIGSGFVVALLLSETLLLFIAAQTGFIDGPRVMANMALDSWLPHRFSALSERLTMHYGILLMGLGSIAVLVVTHGSIEELVTMYSINVFITFSLSTLGMCRFYLQKRDKEEHWKRGFSIQLIAFLLCSLILCVVIFEKFMKGAWMTLVVTSALIIACFLIRRYYKVVYANLGMLSVDVDIPKHGEAPKSMDIKKSTAVLMVGQYGGLGVHALAQIIRLFPDHFEQIVFISAGIIDSGNFKGAEETERLREQTQTTLDKYEAMAQRFGLASAGMMLIGQDPVATLEELCAEVALRYPRATFFAGQLVFQRDAWYQRVLHNETAFAVQRRLLWQGLPMVVLPVRVWGRKKQAIKNTVLLQASGEAAVRQKT